MSVVVGNDARAISFKACCRSLVALVKITSCWSVNSRERIATCRALIHVVRGSTFVVVVGAFVLTEVATWRSKCDVGRTIFPESWCEDDAIGKPKCATEVEEV